MNSFSYIAINQAGKEVKGTIQSDNAKNARVALKAQGLIATQIEGAKEKQQRQKKNISFKKPISTLELSLITRQFSILLNSGMSIEGSLNALADQLDTEAQKQIILGVKAEVMNGRPLAASMRMYPKVFPAVYCSLINAGEQSGSLGKVMESLADYSDRTQALTGKIMMALLYPMVVTVVALLVIVSLLTYVVPQVVKVFESSKQELPTVTKTLIFISDSLRHYGIYILIAIGLYLFYFFRRMKNQEYKINFHRRLLNTPVLGKLLINVDIARFTNTLSLLLSSGVSMLNALEASKDTLSNYMLKTAVERAIELVKEGFPLAQALNVQKAFPPVVIHLINSGEKSGNLEHLLSQAGAHQELELSHRSQLLTGILEPALILVMGAVVLFIVIAIMLPILDMNNLVH